MNARISTIARARAVLAAVIFAGATFAVTASPVSLPLPDALKPTPVLASFCASNAAFTGRLTASSASTVAVARTQSPTVHGYISSVASTWSCTAFYRYSGIAWNNTATTGRFDWGNLINSTSVACNFVVGSTDYIKANSSTDCPDTDAEYALAGWFEAEGVYQADVAHNSDGDFSFIHSDCGSYYNGHIIRPQTGDPAVDFAGATVGNRPGANCDALTLDGTGTTQTITYDSTDPVTTISAPTVATKQASTSYTVQWQATDAFANFGGTNDWDLQRQIAPASNGTCGGFINDTAAGHLVSGTLETAQSQAQALVTGKCYRWTLAATDQNGNAATLDTSATVLVDTSAPTADFSLPNEGSTTTINVLSYSPTWTASDPQSGIASTSLQRQKIGTTSACATSPTADGGPSALSSGTLYTLIGGFCYQWALTVTNGAGTAATFTSGKVWVDAASPSANFATPNEGTTSIQKITTYNDVAWSEAAGTGFTITARSLQRQKGSIMTSGTCAGVTWANDGSAVPTASSVPVPVLLNGQCYRWIQTLTNSAPKVGATTSGSVLVDTTAPAGTITYPETNRPLAGDVVIKGSATDASSFQNYQLEYGSGASPASWTTIGSIATTPVPATGTLGTWATGSLSGVYTVRLTVRDLATNTNSVTTRTVILENAQRGDESFFSRVPFDLGGGYGLDIGVANGEARLSRTLFSIPSYGPSQELGLTYSSLESATTGKFGAGWRSNLTQYLTFDVASNIVTWHRADGGRVPFGNIAGTWTPLRGHFEVFGTGSGVYTITLKDQTKLTFESTGAGRLTKIENRFSKALTLAWSTSSATATDASGRVTTLAIDSVNNRITGATDSAGRVWSFGYTGTDLTTITDPANKVTTLGYDASHHLTAVTRSRSRVSGGAQTITWTVGYAPGTGKATSVSDPDSAPTTSTFTYGAGTTDAAILKEVTGPVRNTSAYEFDDLGRVTSVLDPEGLTTTRAFDLSITAPLDPLSQASPIDESTPFTTQWTYDARGNVLTETRPIDDITDVTSANSYNATNDLLTRSEADNDSAVKLVTKYGYDGSGHLTTVNVNCTTSGTTPPATASSCTGAGTQNSATNLITSYAYTANDQLAFEQDPLGRVTKHAYDTWGNETSTTANCTTSGTTSPSPFSSCTGGGTANAQTNVTTATAYNQSLAAGKAGLPTSTTDPLGNTTTTTYDALGRQLTEVLPGDSSIPALTRTTTYDELGNVLTSDESWTPLGGGSAVHRTTTHVYDLSNRETHLTDPAGIVTTTTYDAAANAIATVADGVPTDRTFDGLGRPLVETRAGVAVTNHNYDGQGNDLSTSTPDGVLIGREFTLTRWIVDETVDPTGERLMTRHAYDRLGRETSSTVDPLGTPIATTTTYDRAGHLLTTTVAGGMATTTYDRAGNAINVTDSAGIVTTTVYDPLNRPITTIVNDVTSPTLPTEDVTSRTYYDAAGNVIASTDPEGISSRTITNVRTMAKTTIANCTDTGTTPTSNAPACVGAGTTNATTNVTSTIAYDGSGAAVLTVSAVGTGAVATTETAYDDGGRVQAVKDPLGTISRTFYTGDQVTTTVVNCTTSGTTVPTSGWESCTGAGTQDGTFNLTTIYAYDAANNRTSETAPNGRVTTYGYDDAGRVRSQIVNDVVTPTLPTEDVTTTYEYDDAGRQAAVRAPTADGGTSAVRRSIFDEAGRLVQSIANCTNLVAVQNPIDCVGSGTLDAETNLVTTYTYDDNGNRIRMVEPGPQATSGSDTTTLVTTQYSYDDGNRLCRVVANATGSTDLQALANPCSTATQTAGTTTANVSTRYTYDGAGNTASMIDANGNTTSYAYDAAGRMTSTTDALSNTIIYAYNDLGQKIRQESRSDPPLTASITWTYDGAGRVETRTANSVTTTYSYDANGNRACSGSGATCTTAADRITATYDRLNRPLTIDDNANGTADTTYSYSLTSPSWTDPTGTYLVTLDKFDRATTIDGPAIGAITTTYRADSQVLSQADPNGNTTDYLYDALGHETSRTTTAGPTTRAALARTFNRAGQVLTESSTITGDLTNGATAYAYDPLARLTSFTRAATATAYGWDEVPNRTSVQVGAGPSVATTYDAANRPLNQNGVTNAYVSDADGRLTTQPSSAGAGFQRYVWDSLGRLTQVKPPTGGSTVATYTYDPLDRLRMADYGGSNRTRFRYVGLTTSVAQTIDDQTSAVIRNIGTSWTGERQLDWTGTNSNIRYYGTNAHHDTVWTASSTGTVSATLRYDPWGTLTNWSGTSLPDFRFQGSWHDTTTSIAWVVTRWYAPALGRFLSEDSLLGEPADPPSRHLYAYAEGEPIASWDPDGRAATCGGLGCTALWSAKDRRAQWAAFFRRYPGTECSYHCYAQVPKSGTGNGSAMIQFLDYLISSGRSTGWWNAVDRYMVQGSLSAWKSADNGVVPSHVSVTPTYLWWYYTRGGYIKWQGRYAYYGGAASRAWNAHQASIWAGVLAYRSLLSTETFAERIVMWKVLNNLESYYRAGHPADWALGFATEVGGYPKSYPATLKKACFMSVIENSNVNKYFPKPTGYYDRCTTYWQNPWLP